MISVNKLPLVVHKYKNETITVDEIVITRNITFLVGTNGKGKSTYLKVLSSVIPHPQMYLKVSFRFMAEKVVFPKYVTAQTYLDEIIRIDKTATKNRCQMWIKTLHFEPFLKKDIDTLSKGNKQKLNLIQLLSCDVPLYLMDEPFSGLDKQTSSSLMNGMIKSNKQFIITTHIEDVTQMKDCEVVYL